MDAEPDRTQPPEVLTFVAPNTFVVDLAQAGHQLALELGVYAADALFNLEQTG